MATSPISPTVTVVYNRIPELLVTVPAKVGAAVSYSAALLEGRIVANISAKGIVDTGLYINSWNHEMTDDMAAEVNSPVEYGMYNEYGTVHMAARPHILPAVETVRPIFSRLVSEAIG